MTRPTKPKVHVPVFAPGADVAVVDSLVQRYYPLLAEKLPASNMWSVVSAGGRYAPDTDDVVVEVPAIVSKRGIQPIHVGALPPKLMLEALLPHWLDVERNLLSFKTGDRSILLWNALDSHQTRSYDQAMAVMEDLLKMKGHEEMNDHFRWPANW